MPPSPKRPCAKTGCRNTVQGKDRWCKDHAGEQTKYQKAQDRRRGTAAQRGYTWRWAQYSKSYRARHPLCVECERQGRVTPAQHVDHIQAVSGPDDPMFWDESNHTGLCAPCHSRKTAKQDGGFGN